MLLTLLKLVAFAFVIIFAFQFLLIVALRALHVGIEGIDFLEPLASGLNWFKAFFGAAMVGLVALVQELRRRRKG